MRSYFGTFSSGPQVTAWLWGTLLLGVVARFNLLFIAEIWPHTPLAERFWARTLWVALVLAGPQVWLCGWHLLRGYQGPGVVRLGLTASYLGGSCFALLLWLILLFYPSFYLGHW